MTVRPWLLLALFVSSGCFGVPTAAPDDEVQRAAPLGDDDAPSLVQATELHLTLRRVVPEFGFRVEFNLSAAGSCRIHHFGYWQERPHDIAPYFFHTLRGPGVSSVGPFVIRSLAHVHHGEQVDTRRVVPSPWITLMPLDLEGHYRHNQTIGLGGRFAMGPIAYTVGLRHLKPDPAGTAYAFNMECTVPFDVLRVERLDQIHTFNMNSMANGTGFHATDYGSNQGSSLRAQFAQPGVRLAAHDMRGQGSVRLEGPARALTWNLRPSYTEMDATGGPGAYRLQVDRDSGSDRNNAFFGLMAGATELSRFEDLEGASASAPR